jgi:MFS family permease
MRDLSTAQGTVATAEERVRPARGALFKRYFLVALLISTWLPIIFFILLAPAGDGLGGLAGVKYVLLFLGTAHVPTTFFFYTDREFSEIIRGHKVRYVYAPILLTVATGLAFALAGHTFQAFILLAYWAWQAFHYGRQNVGIYAFAAIAQTGTAPHRAEKLAIEFGTILGILGTFKILGMAVAPGYLHGTFNQLYNAGYVAFAAVFVFGLVVYLKFYRDTTAFKTLFFFTSVFFFFPVFISTEMNVAFLSYAIAHGLQYIIFMTVISANAKRGADAPRAAVRRGVWKLLLLLLVAGFAFWRVGDLKQVELIKGSWFYTGVADFLFGAVLGATMSHFVIDAGAWKLSMARQRAYISKRFDFIFDKG